MSETIAVRESLFLDYDLIRNIQETGDNNSYLELRRRYEKAYYSVCHKYMRGCLSLGLQEEEILGNMDYIMFLSASSFDFSRKLKFSTWLSNQARYFCLNSMRKGKKGMDNINNRFNTTESDEELSRPLENLISKSFGYKEISDEDSNNINFILSKIQNEESKNILKLRYGGPKKLSWREISDKTGINYNHCKKLHDRTLNMFRYKMVNNTLSDVI